MRWNGVCRNLLLVVLLALAVGATATEAEAVSIAYSNSGVADMNGSGATLYNMLVAKGHTVTQFGGYTDAQWQTALATADLVMIPEMRRGDMSLVMTPGMRSALNSFVTSGGGVIFNGTWDSRVARTINSTFASNVVHWSSASGGSSSQMATTIGTPYELCPAGLSHPWGVSLYPILALPANATPFYSYFNAYASVFGMDFGSGRAVVNGYTWGTGALADWQAVMDANITYALQMDDGGNAIPEPITACTFLCGVGGLVGYLRRAEQPDAAVG